VFFGAETCFSTPKLVVATGFLVFLDFNASYGAPSPYVWFFSRQRERLIVFFRSKRVIRSAFVAFFDFFALHRTQTAFFDS